MEIVSVKLVTKGDEGQEIPPQFYVGWDTGLFSTVPNDPLNANYWEVKEWYQAQEVKPFEFEFGG